MTYVHAFISAEQRAQGLNILGRLIEKRLVFGGPVLNGPAMFLWNNEIVSHDYCFILTYTREDLKEAVIREAEAASAEEFCMISFVPFDGSPALIRLLDREFADRGSASPPKPIDALAALTFRPTEEIANHTSRSYDQ